MATAKNAVDAASAMYAIRYFISLSQRQAIRDAVQGEEGEFFADKLVELQTIIEWMPKLYETDGQGDGAVAHLHYFIQNGWDWYITEKDVEDHQDQAFGLINGHEVELWYISIDELIGVGAELDLYWTPKTLGDIRKELKD